MRNLQGRCVGVALIAVLGLLAQARGQEEKLVLNPPLGQIFPLEAGPGGVRLKVPVLLNERTILRPDVVLRFIYIDPNAGLHARGGGSDDGGPMPFHHHSDGVLESNPHGPQVDPNAFPQGGDSTSAPSRGSTGEISTEKWNEAGPYRDALNQAAVMGTTVVYSVPGKQKPQSTVIDLPDGMLLAEVGNHVQVLGLTGDSTAFQGGVRPGDEIRSFQGNQPVASLKDFLQAYFAVKEAARKNNQPYSIEVWRPSESRQLTIQIGAPPNLNPML
jgi:hypothetical protein